MSFLEPTTILAGKPVLNTRILKRRAVDAGRDSLVSFRNARGASVAAVLHKHDAYKLAMRICCSRGLSGGTPRHATTPGHDWAQRNAFIRSSVGVFTERHNILHGKESGVVWPGGKMCHSPPTRGRACDEVRPSVTFPSPVACAECSMLHAQVAPKKLHLF